MPLLDAIKELYGPQPLPEAAGVLHVAAVWDGPSPPGQGAPEAMKIEADTPKSDTDFFTLELARARADAIIITGSILRAEPTLTYSLVGTHAPELMRWREGQGRTQPPVLVILTRGELPQTHPAYVGWARPVVLTTDAGARKLALPHRVQVVARHRPGVRDAVAWACESLGATTVCLEAGPSAVGPLYRDATAPPNGLGGGPDPGQGHAPMQFGVDELMLSVCRVPNLPQRLHAGPFFSWAQLRRAMLEPRAPVTRSETSGLWRFHRFVRE